MPTTTPKQMIKYVRLLVQEQSRKPAVKRMQPVRDMGKGPILSCSRPAMMNAMANTKTAHAKTLEVSARFQPNSFSRGATKTLQA